jgi:hypothetical protein
MFFSCCDWEAHREAEKAHNLQQLSPENFLHEDASDFDDTDEQPCPKDT